VSVCVWYSPCCSSFSLSYDCTANVCDRGLLSDPRGTDSGGVCHQEDPRCIYLYLYLYRSIDLDLSIPIPISVSASLCLSVDLSSPFSQGFTAPSHSLHLKPNLDMLTRARFRSFFTLRFSCSSAISSYLWNNLSIYSLFRSIDRSIHLPTSFSIKSLSIDLPLLSPLPLSCPLPDSHWPGDLHRDRLPPTHLSA
jgi:hypothetical protein